MMEKAYILNSLLRRGVLRRASGEGGGRLALIELEEQLPEVWGVLMTAANIIPSLNMVARMRCLP